MGAPTRGRQHGRDNPCSTAATRPLRALPEQHRRGFNGAWGEQIDARLHLDAWRRVLDREDPDYAH
jgi:hypothetical protein